MQNGLQTVFESYPNSKTDAANGIASAFASYISDAMFGSSTPTFTTQEATFAATLLVGMDGTSASFANAFQTGLIAYLTSVPIAGSSGTGTSIPPTGASTISASLLAVFNSYPSSLSSCASQIATILHTATLTTSSTLTLSTPPGPVIVPIS